MKATSGLRPRRLAEVVPQRMSEEPVVILTGPRTVGKSTLLAALADEFDRPVLDLDRPDARAAAASDPSFIVSGPGPVLIDEFQHVPEILDAIKAELNTDTRPGRYVLTGSTRYSVLPQAAQPLTGRAHIINVLPLSQGELHGHRESFIDRLWADPARPIIIPALVSDRIRTAQIIDDVVHAIRRGRNCLVMAGRTEHVDQLAAELNARGLAPMVLHGSISPGKRRVILKQLADWDPVHAREPMLLAATASYIGEGFDCPALDTLFLCSPSSSESIITQNVGRIMRDLPSLPAPRDPAGGPRHVRPPSTRRPGAATGCCR